MHPLVGSTPIRVDEDHGAVEAGEPHPVWKTGPRRKAGQVRFLTVPPIRRAVGVEPNEL